MRRIIRAAAILAVIALPVACSKTTDTQGNTTVTIDQAKIAAAAKGVLTGAEQAAAVYMARSTVSAADKENIQKAEDAADALVASLPTVKPADFAAAIQDAENAINAVIAALPVGLVPPAVTAGVAALEIMVNAVVPLLQAQNAAPVPSAPVAASVVLRH
jgi:hypothetical protein